MGLYGTDNGFIWDFLWDMLRDFLLEKVRISLLNPIRKVPFNPIVWD